MSERVLCWLVDHSSGSQIVADDKSNRWPALFNYQGSVNYRFLFPIMDLDEATQIQPVTIENAFMSPLLAASRRYDADKLLLGQLQRSNGEWILNWQLHDGRDGRALIRGQATGMPNQLAAQIVSALESYIQERNSVVVQSPLSPAKSNLVIAGTEKSAYFSPIHQRY